MQHQNSRVRDRRADGISEVVGFVIILAVVVAGMSLYLTYAVPVQGREEEIREMDSVRSWFVDYKTGMDQLWVSSPLVPERNNTEPGPEQLWVSSPLLPESHNITEPGPGLFNATVGQVTLRKVLNTGTLRERGFVERYLPLLAPIPSSASVATRNQERLIISRWRNESGTLTWIPPDIMVETPSLSYTSNNYYWLQQEYYYQLGGVFLRQSEGGGPDTQNVSIIAAPPLSIYDPSWVDPFVTGLNEQTKVEIVVVNMTVPTGGIGATSPIRVETRLNRDLYRPVEFSEGVDYDRVDLQFDAANAKTAEAWRRVFEGAATRNDPTRNCLVFTNKTSGNSAYINITEPANADPDERCVLLDVLVADFSMRMENVPTLIE